MTSVFELSEVSRSAMAGGDEGMADGPPGAVAEAWNAISRADVGGVVRMLHNALGTAGPETPPPSSQTGPQAAADSEGPKSGADGAAQKPGSRASFRQRLEELATEHEELQAWCSTLASDNQQLRGRLVSLAEDRDQKERELDKKQRALEDEQRAVASMQDEKQAAVDEKHRARAALEERQRAVEALEEKLRAALAGRAVPMRPEGRRGEQHGPDFLSDFMQHEEPPRILGFDPPDGGMAAEG
eukprot:CAMPEP_0179098576 /NCGR_PEP_ID=MMETSP0796-20121207/45435_1 /TAXON_ID=73915 /ORGANISM="Pyrodinium bahamense, Strain pbaha01" /LENGTH=242 /DNA_ID=CAMNT_0020796359 /DNA_START=117 /DNA_END=841 /DNA_ORIENTATION=+